MRHAPGDALMTIGSTIWERLGQAGPAVAEACGEADLLVGIPVANHGKNVGRVVERAAAGLAQHVALGKTVVLVVAGGPHDGALELLPHPAPAPAPAIRLVHLATASRGMALLAILAAAARPGLRALALADAGLESLSPEGLSRLLGPILAGDAAYVSPAYSHAASEGTLTTNLLAPLLRALYGHRLTQVVGGCAALSGQLLQRFLAVANADPELAERAAEVWLPTEAVTSGSAVAEAAQGRKRLDPGLSPPDLATTLVQVVGPFFTLMERYRAIWFDVQGSREVPLAGERPAFLPPVSGVKVERMVHAFRLGLKDLLPLWEEIVPDETLGQLYPLGVLAPDEFVFPPRLWAQTVYAFAVAHHDRRLPREHLLRALTPLYLGRTAAFLLEAQAAPPERMAELPEQIGRAFEAEKDVLRARWR